jgi:quinol monooxygenase YgiN
LTGELGGGIRGADLHLRIKRVKGGIEMIAVIAKLSIKEGNVEEALALITEMVGQVAQEKDTLAYSVNREKQKPNLIVIIERYRDKAALNHHSSTPYFKEFSAKIGALLTGKPEISVLEEITSI